MVDKVLAVNWISKVDGRVNSHGASEVSATWNSQGGVPSRGRMHWSRNGSGVERSSHTVGHRSGVGGNLQVGRHGPGVARSSEVGGAWINCSKELAREPEVISILILLILPKATSTQT